MRMICPNCGAQYEVAEDVIPEAGRDVQCSNCGNTWFEDRGASEAAELGVQQSAPPTRIPTAAPAPKPTMQPEQQTAPPAPRGRELNPNVADILREEAEFEQAARQSDSPSIETQPDLDLSQDPKPEPETFDSDADRRNREARDRLARLRGEPDIETAVSATMAHEASTPRRELLPDIEEINSSLRPDAAVTDHDIDDDLPPRRSGFRRGFVLMVFLVLVALAAYIFAPQISVAVPQLEPALTSYVTWIDGLRIWLDTKIQTMVAADTAETPEG